MLDEGIRRILGEQAHDGKVILKNTRPEKMSEVLADFAKPLLEGIDQLSKAALKATFTTAVVV